MNGEERERGCERKKHSRLIHVGRREGKSMCTSRGGLTRALRRKETVGRSKINDASAPGCLIFVIKNGRAQICTHIQTSPSEQDVEVEGEIEAGKKMERRVSKP